MTEFNSPARNCDDSCLSGREICVTYYIDDPENPGTPLPTHKALVGIYKVTESGTILVRVETRYGVTVPEGTAIGQYQIIGDEDCLAGISAAAVLDRRELCVTYYEAGPTPVVKVLVGVYEMNAIATTFLRAEKRNGDLVVEGTAEGEYQIIGTEVCDCDTERL